MLQRVCVCNINAYLLFRLSINIKLDKILRYNARFSVNTREQSENNYLRRALYAKNILIRS